MFAALASRVPAAATALFTSALAQSDDAAAAAGLSTFISLALAVVMLAAMWVTYQKAGQPGWACIIPIYNLVVLMRIVGRPWWWLLLMLVPFVNFVILIVVYLDLARVFGRSAAFGIGLILLAPIFFLILAFGGSKYVGTGRPVAQAA
jgi:hypothetical protein